ncbi:MAG TPA: YtxH domain-containing protein [Chthonomonadales bacterium]|nr:YtxH domain-containing protein [Chthonomonadales bacterium]
MNKDNWGGNLVFFLLGASVGAALALLYAPQEGEATRKLLADKAGEYKDKAGEVTGAMAQTAKSKIGAATDKVNDMLNRTQQAARDSMETASDKAEAATSGRL